MREFNFSEVEECLRFQSRELQCTYIFKEIEFTGSQLTDLIEAHFFNN